MNKAGAPWIGRRRLLGMAYEMLKDRNWGVFC